MAATVELAPGERRADPVRAGLGPADGRVRGRPPLVEAVHAGLGPHRRRARSTWPSHALERTPDLARRDRGVAGADPRRSRIGPTGTRRALFNELYFLVDGGSFWEAGEVDGPEPEPDDAGRFALLECTDYPFYDSVDVDFYASFAILRLFPELEVARHPRPAGRGRGG